MTINNPLPPNREELGKFLPDLRTIRAFEELFKIIPSEINNTNDLVETLTGTSGTISNLNASQIQRLLDSITSVKTVSSNYSAIDSDYHIVLDGSSNTVQVTLPQYPKIGKQYKISCSNSTFDVTINFNGNTFNSSLLNFQIFQDETIEITFNSSEWRS